MNVFMVSYRIGTTKHSSMKVVTRPTIRIGYTIVVEFRHMITEIIGTKVLAFTDAYLLKPIRARVRRDVSLLLNVKMIFVIL